VAGAALYLALPKLIAVLGAWPRLSTLNPAWFTVCLAAELSSFTCTFALERLALRTRGLFPVVLAAGGRADRRPPWLRLRLPAGRRARHRSPPPVLLAYSAAGIVALFPVTPGGVGIVEASLSGLSILAGVRAGYAVLAYRIASYRIAPYWLPLLAGPPAYLLFRHRYGRPVPRRAAPGGADPTA
jgi:uncharacterized membrane protein YbhN (UPF0104 family)